MCGRFAAQLPPELLRRAFAAVGDIPNTPPSWNVAPTQAALVVRRHPETRERRLDALRWGLVPHFTKDLKACKRPINARSEGIANWACSAAHWLAGGESIASLSISTLSSSRLVFYIWCSDTFSHALRL